MPEPPPQAPPATGGWRRLLRLGVQAAVVAFALWLVGRMMGAVHWRELVDRLRAADPTFTALAVVLLVGRFVVWDLRWRLALERLGDLPSAFHSFFTLLGAVCANTMMPTARVIGGLLRARYTSGRGEHTFGRVYGVVLFDQIAHQTVMAVTGWLAFAGMAFQLGMRGLAFGSLVALLMSAILATTWLGRWVRGDEDRFTGFIAARVRRLAAGKRIRGVVEHGREAVGVVRTLFGDSSLRRQALALGVLYMLLNSLAQWVLFRAMAQPVDLLTVLVAVTLGTAAGAFSGTPGGVGTTEAGMVLAYVALEVPQVEAAAGTLFYRGLHYLVILALGLPALLVFEGRLRQRQREEETAG
jgi:uncharacterized protein (TIRG00374 family)